MINTVGMEKGDEVFYQERWWTVLDVRPSETVRGVLSPRIKDRFWIHPRAIKDYRKVEEEN